MKILGMAHELGSKHLDNSDVLNMVGQRSVENGEAVNEEVLQQIEFFFDYSGIKSRKLLSEDQSPIEMIQRTADLAINRASLSVSDIDMVIHAGVNKGFLEPGQAHFCAKVIGAKEASCFDVTDACNSWLRALQIVDSLMKGGGPKNVLLISSECGRFDKNSKLGGAYHIRDLEELEYKFPALTVGAGCVSTVLSVGGGDFTFVSNSLPQYADLCAVPLNNYREFCTSTEVSEYLKPDRFVSFGKRMHAPGKHLVKKSFHQLGSHQNVDCVLTHGHTYRAWLPLLKNNGLEDKMGHNTYCELGNLAAASIPISLSIMIEEGRVKRGQNLLLLMAAAGMTSSASHWRY